MKLTKPSDIKAWMEVNNCNFQKKFGQNFLINDAVLDKMFKESNLKSDKYIVEIGPGIGAMTSRIAAFTDEFTAIEIDNKYASWIESYFKNAKVINRDVLEVDFSKFPSGMQIIGNLPYNITTPIIMHILENDIDFSSLHFLMQKEVAQRIVSEHSTKEYGRLSILCQALCNVELGLVIKPENFMPRPKVDSQLVHFYKKDVKFEELKKTFELVKVAFAHRRKTLRKNLKGIVDEKCLEKFLIDSKKTLDARPENLSVQEYIRLSEYIR